MDVGDVLIAGQCMADHHRIAALGIEPAIGLVGDLERRKFDAGIELAAAVGTEAHEQGLARNYRPRGRASLVGLQLGLGHHTSPGLRRTRRQARRAGPF